MMPSGHVPHAAYPDGRMHELDSDDLDDDVCADLLAGRAVVVFADPGAAR